MNAVIMFMKNLRKFMVETLRVYDSFCVKFAVGNGEKKEINFFMS